MKFTITATITYDVDVYGKTAQELVDYCHKHRCELGEALWFKQFHEHGFDLYNNADCDVCETDFSTENITYEGVGEYDDDIDNFIVSTADAYNIPKRVVAAILNSEWYWNWEEDDE